MERAEIPKAPGIGLLLDNASGQQDFPFPSLLSSPSLLPFSPFPPHSILDLLSYRFILSSTTNVLLTMESTQGWTGHSMKIRYKHSSETTSTRPSSKLKSRSSRIQTPFPSLLPSTGTICFFLPPCLHPFLHLFHPSLLPIDPSSLPCDDLGDDLDLSHSMMHWLSSLLKHDFTYYLKPEQSQTPAPESQMQQSQATVSCDMQSQASAVSCDMQESQASVSCDMQSQASVSCDMQESQASVSCDVQSQASAVSCDMQESQASVSCDMQSQASAVSCDMQESQASVPCDLQQTQDSSSCDTLRDHSPVAEQDQTLSEKNTPF